MNKKTQTLGIEINPKLIGALLTEKIGDTLRLFCFYTNANISQVDVPAEENADNLRGLFTTLNMEETCTSLVLDEVVQGRAYFKNEERHWLYTLLKSSQNTLPSFNADFADLPWRVIWRSSDTQVLEFGAVDEAEHCFCIRKEISEEDSARIMKNSKAFTKPLSIPRKQSQRWIYTNLGLAVLGLAALMAGALVYTLKENIHAPLPAAPGHTAVAPTGSAVGYFVLYNHQISGPFPLKVITDLNAAGLLNADVLCRPENSNDWIKPADLSLNQPKK